MESSADANSVAGLAGQTLGAYEIVELLAVGGMGAVYKAWQPVLHRHVAIKVLSPEFADETDFRVRFQQEAEIVARLEHPNILPIFDYGHYGDMPYIVMPLVTGGTLLDWEPGPLDEALQTFNRVLKALDYAHTHQVVHRDVKPNNVLLSHDDWPLLGDFGLAIIAHPDGNSPESGHAVGTPAFMAPEQIEEGSGDARADLYAMGVILFAVLTGELPYDAENRVALMRLHVNAPIPLPSAIAPELSPVWDEVIKRALAKDPNERYQTAREFEAAIQSALLQSGHQVASETDELDVLTLCDQAAQALSQNDWPRVMAACGRILESAPDHPAATYLLTQAQDGIRRQRAAQLLVQARAAWESGQLDEARRCYRAVRALQPALVEAATDLAALAADDAASAEALEPAEGDSEAAAWYEQGVAATAHRDWLEATAAFRQVLVLAPGYRDAAQRLAAVERALAQGDAAAPADDAAGLTVPQPPTTAEPAETSVAPGVAGTALDGSGGTLPNTILLADYCGSAAFGHLPATSPAPETFDVAYQAGRYTIAKRALANPDVAWVPLPGSYRDAALVVDVQVLGTSPDRFLALRCRSLPDASSGYLLRLSPATGSCQLTRFDGQGTNVLGGVDGSAAIRPDDAWNHVELRCSGTTLTALVNGMPLVSARDEMHGAGALWLGIGTTDGSAAEGVFAGFLIVQL